MILCHTCRHQCREPLLATDDCGPRLRQDPILNASGAFRSKATSICPEAHANIVSGLSLPYCSSSRYPEIHQPSSGHQTSRHRHPDHRLKASSPSAPQKAPQPSHIPPTLPLHHHHRSTASPPPQPSPSFPPFSDTTQLQRRPHWSSQASDT